MFTNLDIYYNEMKLGIQELVSIKLQIKELQKEEKGDIWISEKSREYFVVRGTPGLTFVWEIKARQRDYEYHRLDAWNNPNSQGKESDLADLALIYLYDFCVGDKVALTTDLFA